MLDTISLYNWVGWTLKDQVSIPRRQLIISMGMVHMAKSQPRKKQSEHSDLLPCHIIMIILINKVRVLYLENIALGS